MKPQRVSVQSLAGLFAMLVIGFVVIAPLVGAVGAALETGAELKQRKAAAELLAARMDQEREGMMQAPELYLRSASIPDATALNEMLRLTCERVVQHLQNSDGNAGCSYSSSELGDAFVRQDATLTASGDAPALLEALDAMDPDTRLTLLSLTDEPGQTAATMELRLHGIARKTEASE